MLVVVWVDVVALMVVVVRDGDGIEPRRRGGRAEVEHGPSFSTKIS